MDSVIFFIASFSNTNCCRNTTRIFKKKTCPPCRSNNKVKSCRTWVVSNFFLQPF